MPSSTAVVVLDSVGKWGTAPFGREMLPLMGLNVGLFTFLVGCVTIMAQVPHCVGPTFWPTKVSGTCMGLQQAFYSDEDSCRQACCNLGFNGGACKGLP